VGLDALDTDVESKIKQSTILLDIPMSNPQLADELKVIESLSKTFAAALGVLYLLGFLVMSSYLSQYGVSSFSALHLQYLIAGTWVLGPPVVLSTLRYASQRFDERAAPGVEGKFNWRRFAVSSLFSGLPSIFFVLLIAVIPNVVESMNWKLGIRLYLFYWAMVSCAQIFWMSRHVNPNQETWWLNRSHASPFYLALLFTIVMSYTVWFSVRIYPLIPFSLGGGRPLTIVFIEGEKQMPDEIQRIGQSTKRSAPYKLLLSTDRYYVILSPMPQERSIEISRDSVAGIIILD
jgi:hypothetical protein